MSTIDLTYKAPRVVSAFMQSPAPFKAILGPFGSGKSVGCCMDILSKCSSQLVSEDGYRHSRWAVVRNVRQQLMDTTLKTWMDWIKPGVLGYWKESTSTFYLEFNDVRAEIMFRALDTPADVQKLMSLELTGSWLNECQFIPREIVEGLQGRLGRYPSQRMGGSNYWAIIADTNPPEVETYWYRIFEHLPIDDGDENSLVQCDTFKQPSGLSPNADNLENLVPGYYEKLSHGKSKSYVDAVVHALYPASQSGKPVYANTFRQERHVSPVPLKVDPMLPVIMGFDTGLCYDDQTEVLTSEGWKFFADVDADTDLAATLNPETKQLEYTPINFKVAEPFNGDLIRFATQNLDFCVTPEHRTPFTFRDTPERIHWTSAEDLAGRLSAHRYIQTAAEGWTGTIQPAYPCNMEPRTFAQFMGWWLSEGTVGRGDNRIGVAQTKNTEALRQVLAKIPLPWVYNGVSFRASDKELAAYVRPLGLQKSRYIPKEVLDMPPTLLEAFLDAFTAGDGSLRDRDDKTGIEHVIYTASRQMAGDFQEVALKLGWCSSMTFREPSTSTMKDGRQITGTGVWIVRFKKNLKRAELLPRCVERVPYSGTVYCLNVPYHTLYVRRNGKPCWNGNTPAMTFKQMGLDGRVRVLREIAAFDMGMKRCIQHYVRPMIKNFFPNNPLIFIGDPAGVRRGDGDESSAFKELKTAFEQDGAIVKAAATNDPRVRIQATEQMLCQYPDGDPLYIIDPCCKRLIEGLRSKYRYPKLKQSGAYAENPEKNEWGHLVEGDQYSNLFLQSGRYSAADYMRVTADPHGFMTQPAYRPAQKEGY